MTAGNSWKAGKLNWDGRMVTADPRKGTLALTTSDDGLKHVTWTERNPNKTNASAEEDLIVMEDAYLQKIPECTTGRAYVMRYTSSDRKFLIWMQEPDATKDDERIKGFNDAIGATIPATAPASSAPAAAPAAPGAPQGQTPAQQAEIRAQLMRLLNPGAAAADPVVHVHDVLTQEACTGLLSDEAATAELCALMPEGMQSPEDLRKALTSPQMRQAMNVLTHAIHSDQIGVLFASLGLDANAAQGSSGNFAALCKALQDKHGKKD
jgi:hypothetical protein